MTRNDVHLLARLAKLSGIPVNSKEINLVTWRKGSASHKPQRLPDGYFAVYIFKHGNMFLKVGKVSGEKNNDRYYQHHYIPSAANSTLAKSLLEDTKYAKSIGTKSVRIWICENTSRHNILIPISYGSNFVNFAEAFFILKCNPRFEGKRKTLSK